MVKRFEPVQGMNAAIIESVMSSEEVSNLPEDKKFKIRLCVEEIEENILDYSGTVWVEIYVSNKGDELSIGFRDSGIKFNPLERPDPDVNATLEERKIGGLGIFLCKQMMDSVSYTYDNGCNELTMKLKI